MPEPDNDRFPFAGQVALVTGGGSGIGRATALALSDAGADVVLVGRRRAALEEVAQLVRGRERSAWVVSADLEDPMSGEHVAALALAETGAVDLLIHSAAGFERGTIEDVPVEHFDRLWRVNVRAPLALTRALLPVLRERQGQVVFLNSTAALDPRAEVGHYAMTKVALRAFADVLRAEVGADGVRVLSLYPGRTDTPMQQQVQAMEGRWLDREALMAPAEVARILVEAIRLSRTAEVTDLTVRPARPARVAAR